MVIPNVLSIRQHLLYESHDVLAHPGFEKTYDYIRKAVFWETLRQDVLDYCVSCETCQRNKSCTTGRKPPVRMLPIPTLKGLHIGMDFKGPFPLNETFDNLLTVTERPGGYVRMIPCNITDTAEKTAERFYTSWVREFGTPTTIVCDRDKLWTSKFWTSLADLTGTKLLISTTFHPETDSLAKLTNKIIGNCLCCVIDGNRTEW